MSGQIIRLKDLIAYTGLSRSAIYDRMSEKSPRYDETFPKSFSLGPGAIGWFKEEVDRWLTGRASQPKTLLRSSPSKPPSRSPAEVKTKKSPKQRPIGGAIPGSLGHAILVGSEINARLNNCLQMESWTPAMGALLISGIIPLTKCEEIPEEGCGIDGEELHASHRRFHEARRHLRRWVEWIEDGYEAPPSSPQEFLLWCTEAEVKSEWLDLMLELSGHVDSTKENLTPSRLAMLTWSTPSKTGR